MDVCLQEGEKGVKGKKEQHRLAQSLGLSEEVHTITVIFIIVQWRTNSLQSGDEQAHDATYKCNY